MAVIGEATVQVRADTTQFATQLSQQIERIVSSVGAALSTRLTSQFSGAGNSAAQAFAGQFQQTGQQVAVNIGQGLEREAPAQISRAASRVVQSTGKAFQDAGKASGTLFAGGVGEGFAALAAFAISARVGRFFQQTVRDATDFQQAFAGVRKTVEGTPEDFRRLEDQIRDMARQLPFAAAEIAKVGQVAGQLGVPLGSIQSFTETILKLGVSTSLSTEEAATALARLANVTKTPLSSVEQLGSSIVALGNNFATNETEIVNFASRLAALSPIAKLSAADVLGLSTGLAQSGARAEASGTALIRTFQEIQKAASGANEQGLQALIRTLGLTREEIGSLAQSNPTELFLRFTEALASQGSNLDDVLKTLNLESARLGTVLALSAGSADKMREAVEKSNTAFQQGTALQREFSIFSGTAASRLQVLQNRFTETRIELGGKLAPVLTGIFGPLSNLHGITISLAAGFAGLAAGGFAFIRLSNIFKAFSTTIAGNVLTQEGFNLALTRATVTGESFQAVLAQLKSGALVYKAAAEGAAQGTLVFGDAEAAAAQKAVTFGSALATAQAKIKESNQSIIAAQLELSRRIVAGTQGAGAAGTAAARSASDTAELVAIGSQRAVVGFRAWAQSALVAAESVGFLAVAMQGLLKIVQVVFVVDLVTQFGRAIQDALDQFARGKPKVDQLQSAMIGLLDTANTIDGKITAPVEDLNKILGLAAVQAEGTGKSIIDAFSRGPGAITVGAKALRDFDGGLPVLHQVGIAFNAISDSVLSVVNAVPLLGRVITTNSEDAQRKLSGLNETLTKIAQSAGPDVARALFETFRPLLEQRGFDANDLTKGFEGFNKTLADLSAAEAATSGSGETFINNLVALGKTQDEATRIAQQFGFTIDSNATSLDGISVSAEGAKAALSAISAAQSQYQQRVESFLPRFGEFIVDQGRAGAAATRGANDTLAAARRIADAEKALADARRDAARRIADAERSLAEAQAEAIKRVLDAQDRLNASRQDSSRRLRDAQENLQDFEAALARAGGARTAEDIIRLRELQQAVSDTQADVVQTERDGQKQLDDARTEGAARSADAQRKLVQTEQDAADKIADALQKLARAHEDVSKRSAAAGGSLARSIIASTSQLVASFRTNTNELNAFAGGLESLVPRIRDAFGGNLDFSDAFLSRLAELGPAAVPLLRDLNRRSDKELGNLAKVFTDNVKAAKRAADLQFDRFPPNFEGKIRPAVAKITDEMEKAIGSFDELGDQSDTTASAVLDGLNSQIGALQVFAASGKLNLSTVEKSMLDLATNTQNGPVARIEALKELVASLKSKDIKIGADTSQAVSALDALQQKVRSSRGFANILKAEGINVFGTVETKPAQGLPTGSSANPYFVRILAANRALGGTIAAAAAGSTTSPGTPLIVGDIFGRAGRELFIPNTGGAIFRHTDTEKILRALRVAASGRSGNIIQINEVASDLRATARAVDFILTQQAVR